MTKQLTLISSSKERGGRPQSWRLDERTRAVGRRGLTEARAALRAGRGSVPSDRSPRADGRPAPGSRRTAA